ncbi:hypothetical protein AOLI_G00313820 [Acnodon oligacanthus]
MNGAAIPSAKNDDVLHKQGPPPPCSRFEAHMRAHPGPARPPCFLSRLRQPRLPQLLHKGKPVSAPRAVTRTETQRRLQCVSDYTRRRFTEALPSVPASPNPSVASPDPPFCPTPPAQSGTNLEESLYDSSSLSTPTRQEKDGEIPLAGLSSPHLDCEDYEEPEGEMVTPLTMTPEPPATPRTLSSLSDFSRPASSQFSFRTDLSSSLSNAHSVNLSDADADNDGDVGDKDDDGNSDDLEACSSSLSELRFSSFIGSALASCTPPISPECSLSRPLTSHSPRTSSTCFNSKYDHIIHGPNPPLRRASIDKASSPAPEAPSRMAPASPVEACSDWGAFHWPVLPPIASQRGDTETGASLSSPFSRSESDMFAELDAVAPRTGSCLSLDHPDCSDTDPTSPTTDVSPGLAALTIGCDSGDLGSLSRVQLLLLERRASEEEPESPPRPDWSSPLGQRAHYEAGLQVWSVGIPQHYQSTGTDCIIWSASQHLPSAEGDMGD